LFSLCAFFFLFFQEGIARHHTSWTLGAVANKLRQWNGRKAAVQDASFAIALRKRILEQQYKD